MNRRSFATLLLTFFLLVGTAPAAMAEDLGDGSGWANAPGDSAGATFDQGPKEKGTGDPFAEKPDVSIYETYGFGFAEWRGLPQKESGWEATLPGQMLPDAPTLPSSDNVTRSAVNGLNNFGLTFLTGILGFWAMVLRLAYDPSALSLLDPFMRIGTEVFGRTVFMGMFWLTLCVSGLWLLGKARKANFRAVANDGSWVLLTMMLGFAAIVWPFTVAPMADKAVTAVMGNVNMALAGTTGNSAATATDGATASLHKALVYDVWCAGLIGRDAGEKLADEYCPRFLKASTFSYQELAETEGDSEARADLSKEKIEDYIAAGEDLKEASPTAWEHLAGHKPWSRFGVTALAWFGLICSLPFVLLAGLLLFYSLIVLRLAMVMIPLIALIAGYPPMKKHMIRLGDYVVAAFVSALTMGIASAGFVAALGGLMSPLAGVNLAVAYLVTGLMTVAFWAIFKPHKKAMAMMSKLPKRRRSSDVPASDTAAGQAAATTPGGNGPTTDPAGGRYVHATPAETEAPAPSMMRAATSGAAKGAAATVLLGAATGGTVTVAAAAAGAAKGALGSVAAQKVGERGGNLAGAAMDARTARTTRASQTVPPEAHPRMALPAAPAEPTTEAAPSRVYVKGETNPSEFARVIPPTSTEDSEAPVYNIYTGGK